MGRKDPYLRKKYNRERYQRLKEHCKAVSADYRARHPRKRPEPDLEEVLAFQDEMEPKPQPRPARDPIAVAHSLVARAAELAKTAPRDRERGYSGDLKPGHF